ncbi:TusE/DsrC/DsvC family sulfur relay protein [Bowmanella denitrificans]|uniref:Sulfurtransferase n=1 Tax=Bowmanella denitrificans TaxID=366582 RepID=A0ABP3GHW8_9ALTE
MQHSFEFNGRDIVTDSAGYLLNHMDWDETMVSFLAQREGIKLTEAHWEVVLFVRHFYLEFNTSPAIRALVKAMEKKFGPEKGNSRYLQRLFPDGPAKQATKLAGLPKPAKCL